MFTPIAPEVAETIKAEGVIRFLVYRGWEFSAGHDLFTTVPHKVVYARKNDWDNYTRVFNCVFTLDKHSFILENISARSSVPLSKPAEYLFLEMTVEAAERLARLVEKEKLIITTSFSTFSEIASERNFIIKKNRNDFGNLFKAMKMLEYKKGTHKNEKSS